MVFSNKQWTFNKMACFLEERNLYSGAALNIINPIVYENWQIAENLKVHFSRS